MSGRTIGQASHDTVLGIGAYLAELRNEVIRNNTLFKRVLQDVLPKRQLNKALEESKMKITKTQLKQIIKEELEAVIAEEDGNIASVIAMALKNADIPPNTKLRAFYHAAPSDRIFLVPEDDEYFSGAKKWRPTGPPSNLKWNEDQPRNVNFDAKKHGGVEAAIKALRGMGLKAISKDQYTGSAYGY